MKQILSILVFLFTYNPAFPQLDPAAGVFPGIDVLEQNNFKEIEGKKVALLTNHAGRSRDGRLTLNILKESGKVNLTGLFVPEHGFFTTIPAGEKVKDDTVFGVRAYSLYGGSKSPDDNLLKKCDVVVVDLQDIGIRSYTYISTMYNTMKACANAGKPIIILDRPNPIGGIVVDGGVLDDNVRSFVGMVPVSYLHGCTFGELAMMINNEGWLGTKKDSGKLKCELTVIKMKGWERWMAWEDTGLFWYPTSPHIPSVNAVRGAAVLGIIGELGMISIGIGTTSPFQYLGSPDFDYKKFEEVIEHISYNGLVLDKARYQPFYGMYRNKTCNGYYLTFSKDNLARFYSNGINVLYSLNSSNPDLLSSLSSRSKDMFRKVSGKENLLNAIISGLSLPAVIQIANEGLEDFLQIRNNYLIY